ncbi:argininosuccinate lyase, partial [Streptococcus agalactiae]|nr:argininosuccinate lyase [Streptococcus agalactiae]MCK6326139.1 argininosuccinate lyase [Streptococcus agalactiae]
PLKYYQEISELIENDIYEILTAKTAVKRRNSLGGTGFDQVKKQILLARKELKAE